MSTVELHNSLCVLVGHTRIRDSLNMFCIWYIRFQTYIYPRKVPQDDNHVDKSRHDPPGSFRSHKKVLSGYGFRISILFTLVTKMLTHLVLMTIPTFPFPTFMLFGFLHVLHWYILSHMERAISRPLLSFLIMCLS